MVNWRIILTSYINHNITRSYIRTGSPRSDNGEMWPGDGAGPLQQGPNCYSGETGAWRLVDGRSDLGYSMILKVCAWTVNSLCKIIFFSVLSSWPMFRIAGDADYGDFDQFHRAVPGGTRPDARCGMLQGWELRGTRQSGDSAGRSQRPSLWRDPRVRVPMGAQNLQRSAGRSPISKFLADVP